jgi:hypothetical protein
VLLIRLAQKSMKGEIKMKKTYKHVIGLLILLALVIGSASFLGAAPVKEPTYSAKITKVVDQTVYYSFKWANFTTPVKSYTVVVAYEYYPDNFIVLSGDEDNPKAVTLNTAKTRFGSKDNFKSLDTTYTIASGDTVQVSITLFDGIGGLGNELGQRTVEYLVP